MWKKKEEFMKSNQYALTLNYENETSPKELFAKFTEFVGGFEDFNNAISSSFSSPEIEISSIITDIEKGSIKVILTDSLKRIDDKKIKERPVREIFGSFIVACKYKILDYLNSSEDTQQKKQAEVLKIVDSEVNNISRELNHSLTPEVGYQIDVSKINKSIHTITSNADERFFSFQSEQGKLDVKNNTFLLSEPTNQEYVNKSILNNAILVIKKPDTEGSSKWGFKHENESFIAENLDSDWINAFKNGDFKIGFRDKIEARVEKISYYDKDNNFIKNEYKILNVIRNIPTKKQRSIDFK